MGRQDPEELFNAAKEYFNEGHYKIVESMIQQLLIVDDRNPEVHYMAATIAFEKGQLKKAIASFRKSLEIDPNFTDSSIGLSIILNDLGKYQDGKKIFEEAYARMKQKSGGKPYFEESLARKHEELGDIYFLAKQYEEALEHFNRANKYSRNKVFYGLKSIDCLIQMKLLSRALREAEALENLVKDNVELLQKLAQLHYQLDNRSAAEGYWEKVLLLDPANEEAQRSLRLSSQNLYMHP